MLEVLKFVFLHFGYAVLSGLFPFINIEAYVLGFWLAGEKLLIFIPVVSAGQTVSKVLLYLAGAGVLKSKFFRSKLEKVLRKGDGNNSKATLVEKYKSFRFGFPALVFISSFLGFPPLYVVSVVAGMLKENIVVFTTLTFLGRLARFSLLVALPEYFGKFFVGGES